jgi:hypothetical protein
MDKLPECWYVCVISCQEVVGWTIIAGFDALDLEKAFEDIKKDFPDSACKRPS